MSASVARSAPWNLHNCECPGLQDEKGPGAVAPGPSAFGVPRAAGARSFDHFDDAVAAIDQHRTVVDDGVAVAGLHPVIVRHVVISDAGARQDRADGDASIVIVGANPA